MSSEKRKLSGVIALTPNGLSLAHRLVSGMSATEENAASKWVIIDKHQIKAEGGMSAFFKQYFQTYENWVFIGAIGIMIRSMAPHLIDKFTDPAVVVLDESGKFAISLLSGHVGGANELSLEIARVIGAVAVVTTATDVNQRASLDTLLKNLKCPLKPYRELILEANKRIVEGENIGIFVDTQYLKLMALDVSDWLPQVPGFTVYEDWESLRDSNLGLKIYVGYRYEFIHKNKPLMNEDAINCVIPKCFILGTGVRKALASDIYADTLTAWLEGIQISPLSIETMASIDIKASEACLLNTATAYGWQTRFYAVDEMQPYERYFEHSSWVYQTVGIGAVSGPAFLLACCGEDGEAFIHAEDGLKGIQSSYKGNGCTFTLGRKFND